LGKATGKTPTYAAWIRDYLKCNPEYKNDSYISERVCYDLMQVT